MMFKVVGKCGKSGGREGVMMGGTHLCPVDRKPSNSASSCSLVRIDTVLRKRRWSVAVYRAILPDRL